MEQQNRFGLYVVLAAIGGALVTLLAVAPWNNTTDAHVTVTAQQPAPITIYVPAAPAQPTVPSTNVKAPIACDIAGLGYTTTQDVVVFSPDGTANNSDTTCALSDTDYHYSVTVFVEPYASVDTYQASLDYDKHPTNLPTGMTQGAVNTIDLSAYGVSKAYKYTGVYNGNDPYTDVVFLATGLDGNTYLVDLSVSQLGANVPALNMTDFAGTAAIMLP